MTWIDGGHFEQNSELTDSRHGFDENPFHNDCLRDCRYSVRKKLKARLLGDKPYFLTEQKGLWQVAKSLCDQLQAVNRRISDALTLDQSEAFVAPLAQQQFSRPPGQSTSSLSVEAGVSSIPELLA